MMLALVLDDAKATSEAVAAASNALAVYVQRYGPEHSECRYVTEFIAARTRP